MNNAANTAIVTTTLTVDGTKIPAGTTRSLTDASRGALADAIFRFFETGTPQTLPVQHMTAAECSACDLREAEIAEGLRGES